ncbi:MAG: Mor transcription activator family protein [Dokdonella sp.]
MSDQDLIGFDGVSIDSIENADVCADEKQWAPLLVDMLRVVESQKRREGMQADAAAADARTTVLALAEYFGGRQIYLPKGEKLRAALMHAEIYKRFNGRNTRDLAAEYRISEIHCYAVIKRQRELHRKKLQGRLFPD